MNKEEWFDKYLSQANQDIQYCEEHHCLKEFVAGLLENNNEKNEIIKSQEKAQLSLQNELIKLQQRIDKAIEYITSEKYFFLNNQKTGSFCEDSNNYMKAHDKLLEILKGDSNE